MNKNLQFLIEHDVDILSHLNTESITSLLREQIVKNNLPIIESITNSSPEIKDKVIFCTVGLFKPIFKSGNFELFTYFLDLYGHQLFQKKLTDSFSSDSAFLIPIFENGHLEFFKQIYAMFPNEINLLLKKDGQKFLLHLCSTDNVEFIHFLLCETPYQEYYKSDDLDLGLSEACNAGYLDIVQYLITHPELKFYADPHCHHYTDEGPLFRACQKGHLHIVHYLLTSSDIIVPVDVHVENDELFNSLGDNLGGYNQDGRYTELAKYLIFEYKVDLTEKMKTYLPSDIIQIFNML